MSLTYAQRAALAADKQAAPVVKSTPLLAPHKGKAKASRANDSHQRSGGDYHQRSGGDSNQRSGGDSNQRSARDSRQRTKHISFGIVTGINCRNVPFMTAIKNDQTVCNIMLGPIDKKFDNFKIDLSNCNLLIKNKSHIYVYVSDLDFKITVTLDGKNVSCAFIDEYNKLSSEDKLSLTPFVANKASVWIIENANEMTCGRTIMDELYECDHTGTRIQKSVLPAIKLVQLDTTKETEEIAPIRAPTFSCSWAD